MSEPGAGMNPIEQVTLYDSARGTANHLCGIFVARKRAADSDDAKVAWLQAQLAVVRELDALNPHDEQAMRLARSRWAEQISALTATRIGA